MASKTLIGRKKYLAKLSDKPNPCAFCNRLVDDEVTYGKLYSIGDIHCHYFCVLLSCCLIQKGRDEDGLFGFLYPDIVAEIERSKKHKCSYCSKGGATLGCSVTQCRKQFHLPCGRERDAVSLFYGNYKTFCRDHAPKQKIPNSIMNKAMVRRRKANKMKRDKIITDIKEEPDETDTVCVICYEKVDGFPTTQTFWPPCCARDAWFHRNCIERMSLSAGVHYLKCPLCNDKELFYKAVLEQGYYVPDRDAAWELEQNAYSEMYERPSVCRAEVCCCPGGREQDDDTGPWDVAACALCGGAGAHRACAPRTYVCADCARCADCSVEDIVRVSLPECVESQSRGVPPRVGPVVTSRMSLRRTKGRRMIASTSSRSVSEINGDSTTEQSRQELNLKSPKKRIIDKYSSPIKLIEREMVERYNTSCIKNFDKVLDEVVEKFRKPRPLVEKRRVVRHVLEGFLNSNVLKESCKTKEDIKEWNSPKKYSIEEIIKTEQVIKIEPKTEPEETTDSEEQKSPSKSLHGETMDGEVLFIQETPKLKKVNLQNDSMEISVENDDVINVDLVEMKNSNANMEKEKQKCLKFNPFGEILEKNTDIDVESFKNQYLNEVDRKFSSSLDKENENRSETIIKKAPKRKRPSGNSVVRKRKATKMVENNRVKNETELSIRNRNINLKIKWKNEELNLKICKRKRNRRRKQRVLKQYVLSPRLDSSEIITRPSSDVTLIKPKKIKTEKSPDNLKQTSISSFFKLKC